MGDGVKQGKVGGFFEDQLIYSIFTILSGLALLVELTVLSNDNPIKVMRDRLTRFLKKQQQQEYQTLGHSTKEEVLVTRPS